MHSKTKQFNVKVSFKNHDERERRFVVSKKLASIINLEQVRY